MYSYLECIGYDKLLKSRQSFRITLYISEISLTKEVHAVNVIMLLNFVIKVPDDGFWRTERRNTVLDGIKEMCLTVYFFCIWTTSSLGLNEPPTRQIVTHENDKTCRNTRYGNTHDSGKKTPQTATTKVGIKGVDGSVNWTNTLQINQPTRCNNFSSLLLDVYVQLNMFRASSRPSSGAQQLQ